MRSAMVVVGVVFVPAFYTVIQGLSEAMGGKPTPAASAEAPESAGAAVAADSGAEESKS